MAERIVKTSCKGCHGGCGVIVTVSDGVITRIEGNPDWPTRGTMCSKGLAAVQHVNNPNRILYPLKRSGQRGEGKWQRISWDEALDAIAAKIKQCVAESGANSVCVGQGTSRGYTQYSGRFRNTIGTCSQVGAGHVCFYPRLAVFGLTVGGRLYCDYHGWGGQFPKTHIVWAKQLEVTNADGEMGVWFLDSLEHAKNLIVVDPRATGIAGRATHLLQLRPGTDAALALGMMNVIINEGLYDREFVANWTHGFDKLRERVQDYPPSKVAEITWIPEEKIVRAARAFAIDTPGCIQIGQPTEASNNTTQNLRAMISLAAITGNIERPGGMVNWMPTPVGPTEAFAVEVPVPEENRQSATAAGVYKLWAPGRGHAETFFRELNEGKHPIRMLHQQGGDILMSVVDTKAVFSGLMKLDFISVVDQFMSPLAEYADIVLPAAHWLETDDIWDMHPTFYVSAVNKVVEPPGEAWQDSKIMNELGKRINPALWFKDIEAALDHQLRKAGVTWKQFREMGFISRTGKDQKYYKYKTDYWRKGGGFNTPTGKVELYSTVLEKLGYDPLPYYIEPNESPYSTPELAKEYPLVLSTGGRAPYYFHSQYRQIPYLRQLQPYPRLQIHPDTAKGLGIAEGDWAWIETPRGRIRQKASLFAGVDPRVVIAQASWWYPDMPAPEHGMWVSNANVLTSSDGPFDPAMGSSSHRALLCKVYRADRDRDREP
ncbi:MAG: molybdopterin-dependent oxidoreductase [Chloroflexi bacterium]|nr:molybdopterin-dependent oxidoreductase [Chloroflexota bacterium]